MAEVVVEKLFPKGQGISLTKRFKQEYKLASLEPADFYLIFALYHHLVEPEARIEYKLKSE